ncbi:MAG: SycD/LcrH family type III secretion system chaperone [Waddliaceae bacterium]
MMNLSANSYAPSQDNASLSSLIEQYEDEKKELPELSEESTETLYAFGFGFYENGKYEKAVQFFRFLTLVNPGKKKYWMGLGASYHMLKDEQCALQCYGAAAILDRNDPYVHLHAAECLFSLGEKKLGCKALHSAETAAEGQTKQDKALLSRIALMKENNQQH